MARVIAIANQKGGVGKTTTTVNVAAVMSEKGWRVLLIDSDPQGNATTSCGGDEYALGLNSLYGGTEPIALVQETAHGFDLIAANGDLAGAEGLIQRKEDMSHTMILKRALVPLKEHYDYILIDTPPSLGTLTINALVAADGVLIPLTPEILPLHGTQELLDTVTMLSDGADALNPFLVCIGAVLTKYRRQIKMHREVKEAAAELFGRSNIPLLSTVIKDCVRFGEAPAIGTPAVLADKKTAAVQDYRLLVEEAFGV